MVPFAAIFFYILQENFFSHKGVIEDFFPKGKFLVMCGMQVDDLSKIIEDSVDLGTVESLV